MKIIFQVVEWNFYFDFEILMANYLFLPDTIPEK